MSTNKTPEQRYREKLIPGPTPDACVGWDASIDKYGNAKFTYTDDQKKHRTTSGHRFGWVLENGPVPDGAKLKNTCDTSSCQNMTHWQLVADGKGLTSRERYEARFTRLGPDDCWPWQEKARDKDGYGILSYREGGRSITRRAIRFGWDLEHPDDLLQDDEVVCHTCDNPPCQNPAHWFKGGVADNNADMLAKGRQHRGQKPTVHAAPKRARGRAPVKNSGEGHYNTRLSWEDVSDIRTRYASKEATQKELANEYGIRREAIGKIIRNERWVVDAQGEPISRPMYSK